MIHPQIIVMERPLVLEVQVSGLQSLGDCVSRASGVP